MFRQNSILVILEHLNHTNRRHCDAKLKESHIGDQTGRSKWSRELFKNSVVNTRLILHGAWGKVGVRLGRCGVAWHCGTILVDLPRRRLEVVGARKNGAREGALPFFGIYVMVGAQILPRACYVGYSLTHLPASLRKTQ